PRANGGVTVRERDSTEQKRLPIDELPETLSAIRAGDLEFEEL
ncbi:His/Gly/Thr/Pro-type tRNA ligase C-terminal domain-containing protein, partial [Natrinema soli]